MALEALKLLAFLGLETARVMGEQAEKMKKNNDMTPTDGAAFISP